MNAQCDRDLIGYLMRAYIRSMIGSEPANVCFGRFMRQLLLYLAC